MHYSNYEDYMRQVLGYSPNQPDIYEPYNYNNNRQTYENTYTNMSDTSMTTFSTMTEMSDDDIESCYPEIYHVVYPMVCKVCETNSEPVTKDLIEKMTDEVYFAIEDEIIDSSDIDTVRTETQKQEDGDTIEVTESAKTSKNVEQIDVVANNMQISDTPRVTETSELEKSKLEQREKMRNARRNEMNRFRNNYLRTPVNKNTVVVNNTRTNSKVKVETPLQENRGETQNIREDRHRRNNSNLRDLIKILLLGRLFGNRPSRPRPPRPPRPPFPPPEPPRPPYPGGPGRPPFQDGRPPFPGNRPY